VRFRREPPPCEVIDGREFHDVAAWAMIVALMWNQGDTYDVIRDRLSMTDAQLHHLLSYTQDTI